jgi:polyisoprenoid-binding protein YceI
MTTNRDTVNRLRIQLKRAMIIKFSALLLTLGLFQLAACSQQVYRLDTSKSTLIWNSGNVGHHNGYIKFSSGSLLVSKEGKPVGGTFLIDMKTIKATDNKNEAKNLETDATMTKPDFFDVPKYPEAKMVVTGIEKIPNAGLHKVTGDLTIKGITHAIVFKATILQSDKGINIQADIDLLRGWWGVHSKQTAPSMDLLSGLLTKPDPDQMFVSIKLLLTK